MGISTKLVEPKDRWGLYIHVPFCANLCSYCDFAKTARYTPSEVQKYFDLLKHQLVGWLNWLRAEYDQPPTFHSAFFGGGTPGLFTKEFEPLMAMISPLLMQNAEITIEANPENVSGENCAIWRSLGINRLSMGIQSFLPEGLKELGRRHDPEAAIRAVEVASRHFDNFNLDLIYGWRGQTLNQWANDLELASIAPHLSLYTLIFEPETPLGRYVTRTVKQYHDDEQLVKMYEAACNVLKSNGFEHEEVSNWSRPGFSCTHNWLYWENQFYVAIGAGAHGQVRAGDHHVWRYSYTKNWQRLMRRFSELDPVRPASWDQAAGVFARLSDSERCIDAVATGLRTSKGVSYSVLESLSQGAFRPTAALTRGMDSHIICLADDRFVLQPNEWFREQFWAVELLRSFEPAKS